jgi:hypothetical protein
MDNIDLNPTAVHERVTAVLTDDSGIKHVFDPKGYPFRVIDHAPIEEMERNRALCIELNAAILNYPGLRVVFLRRRDAFERTISDLVGRVTQQWGSGDRHVSAEESIVYKEAVSKIPFPALDEDLVHWYIQNMPPICQELRKAVTANPVMDVWYEDVLGHEIGLQERIERFREIVDFLQIAASDTFFKSAELALLLRPAAKLNDARIFERIPNYRDLCARFATPMETKPMETKHGRKPVSPGEPVDQAVATAPPDELDPGKATGFVQPNDWRFRASGANVAGVVFPPDQPGILRVVIDKVSTKVSFDIQLNAPDLKIEGKRAYRLAFRARSDRPRNMFVGVAQAHDPWMGLGLYEEIALSPEWREFQKGFVATSSDEQARIHFDLGTDASPVELSLVSLR